ncbi:hypothetical protein PUN28_011283 [Cardiocondyla obscurior]|uniref:Bee-milk protein n=1 Tax=Cardiocondyla obscurior TaxID=286306 RepID=A0AAW2FI49_9HYME
MKYSVFNLFILVLASANCYVNIKTVYEWNYLNYTWENKDQMEKAKSSGNYDPYKCVLYDVAKADDGRIFVTIPKEMGNGVPATLATISNIPNPKGQPLNPYPNWGWHNSTWDKKPACDRIINVNRINIACDHLFVMDNGKVEDKKLCVPKLLIFRLKDNELIKTINISNDIANNKAGIGLLVTPMIYVPKGCSRFLDEMIVFIADMKGYGLIVYDASTNRTCRVESDYMKPSDKNFSLGNQSFTYDYGIFSMTPFCNDLYFSAVSSKEIYKIKIKKLLECPGKQEANNHTKLAIKIPSQTGQVTTVGHSIIYNDSKGTSLMGTNVCNKSDNKTVRFPVQLFVALIETKILLKIVTSNN